MTEVVRMIAPSSIYALPAEIRFFEYSHTIPYKSISRPASAMLYRFFKRIGELENRGKEGWLDAGTTYNVL
jgi:hypothetical protein